MKQKKIIGFYDYTVVVTYLGLAFAFFGIIMALNEYFTESIMLLMAAGICDMFDGTIAATKERNKYEKQFGIQIDSMCDLVSFGVLPAIFMYEISERSKFVGILACIYTLCGLIRLAYFNVQETERQQIETGCRHTYLGIPITSSALVLPFAYILFMDFDRIGTGIFIVVMMLLAVGFVMGVEIKKPNMVGKILLIIFGIMEITGVIVLR